MLSYIAVKGKEPLPRSTTSLPMYKVKGDASWGGETLFDGIEFINFDSDKTWCGMQRKIFTANPTGADYYPIQNFINTVFNNVHDNAIAFLMDPPLGWANLEDCGTFPCTGPRNILLKFTSTSFSGAVVPI